MANYVIVGGGIYGCAVAWELAKQGADVHLLEAKQVASGASGGLGKRGVRANGRDVRELPFMRLAYDQWETLHEEIGGETGYERLGHLLLMERETDIPPALAMAWVQEQQGIPSRFVPVDELREMEPFLSESVIGAIFCPKDGIADHTQTTRSMAIAAQKHGAMIQEGAKVTGLERQGNRVTGVIVQIDDAETRIPVKKELILLSNYHALDFVQRELDVTLPLYAMLPQVMATQAIDPMPIQHLIGHVSRTLAIKPLPDNRVMISGGWRGTWNETTQQGDTVPEQVEGNRQEAVAVYPCLADIAVDEALADRGELISADGIPIIDRLAGADNMIVALGWSGHGWAIAPAVSRLLTQWALSGEKPDLFEPFAYGRFLKK